METVSVSRCRPSDELLEPALEVGQPLVGKENVGTMDGLVRELVCGRRGSGGGAMEGPFVRCSVVGSIQGGMDRQDECGSLFLPPPPPPRRQMKHNLARLHARAPSGRRMNMGVLGCDSLSFSFSFSFFSTVKKRRCACKKATRVAGQDQLGATSAVSRHGQQTFQCMEPVRTHRLRMLPSALSGSL